MMIVCWNQSVAKDGFEVNDQVGADKVNVNNWLSGNKYG